ncbi:MAG: DUF99 family protein [Candidatus Thermoplasmatota archaeon]
MKEQVRAIGIDDAPFEFSQKEVLVVGSVVRAPNYLEGVLSTKVEVDGRDATEKLVSMISDSRFLDQASTVFLDGAALGGFNLIDLEKLTESIGVPSVTVSREKPDFERIRKAMKGHFDEWEERFEEMKSGKLHEIETEHKPIYIQKEGLKIEEVKRLIDLFTVRGRLPEPVRISHTVASGIVRGESQGKP